jgi:uncharacterized protein YeaC (DUF1315 family)
VVQYTAAYTHHNQLTPSHATFICMTKEPAGQALSNQADAITILCLQYVALQQREEAKHHYQVRSEVDSSAAVSLGQWPDVAFICLTWLTLTTGP